MLPTSLLISFLFAIPAATTTQAPFVHQLNPLTFYLRHLHVVTNSSRVLFSDVPQGDSSLQSQNSIDGTQAPYTLMTRMVRTHRPSSFASHARARLKPFSRSDDTVEELTWGEEVIVGPDVTNRRSLLHLAKMTNNAYAFPDDGNGREWYDIGGNWNIVCTSRLCFIAIIIHLYILLFRASHSAGKMTQMASVGTSSPLLTIARSLSLLKEHRQDYLEVEDLQHVKTS